MNDFDKALQEILDEKDLLKKMDVITKSLVVAKRTRPKLFSATLNF